MSNNITSRIESAVQSMYVSSGRDVANGTASSERGEQAEITASSENVSIRNNTLRRLNLFDETRG